jgi:ABC-type spermidine/putrescine transport system permease subunit I
VSLPRSVPARLGVLAASGVGIWLATRLLTVVCALAVHWIAYLALEIAIRVAAFWLLTCLLPEPYRQRVRLIAWNVLRWGFRLLVRLFT